jgi:hypothetical protein
LKSNLYPGPDGKATKVTFIQAKGNLFPGSKGPKATFIQVQGNFYHGFRWLKVTFIQVWAVASRSQKKRDADNSS